VGGIISEWWATSFRNDGRLQSESAIAGSPKDFRAILSVGNNGLNDVDVFFDSIGDGAKVSAEHDPIDPAHLDCSFHANGIEPHRADENV
jgi:hypothetical protein